MGERGQHVRIKAKIRVKQPHDMEHVELPEAKKGKEIFSSGAFGTHAVLPIT